VDPSGEATRAERRILLALLIALALLYLPGIAGQPLDWDDDIWLTDPAFEEPSLAWTTTRDRVYAPLLRLSFSLQHVFFGARFWAWHALHLAMFLLLVHGVWRVLRRFGVERTTAIAAIGLWAFHPTKIESVAWLTGAVKDLQSGLFVVGAALLAASGGSAIGIALLILLAGLTKAATFPLAFALLAAVAARDGWRSAVRRTGPACVVAVGIAAMGIIAWSPGDHGVPISEGVVRAAWVHGTFWAKLFSVSLPAAITPLAPSPWPAIVMGAALTGGFVAIAVRDRRFVVPLVLWILPQIPFLGVVDMGFWAADRYLLFSSLGVALLCAFAWARWTIVLPLSLAMLFAFQTGRRVPDWRSSLALWEAEVQRPGAHPARWFKLGMVYAKEGRFEEAVAAFDHTLALDPDDATALARWLIASLATDGTWTAADAAAAKTLEPVPASAADWRSAADALVRAGRPDLATRASARAGR